MGYVSSLDYPIVVDGETFFPGGSEEDYIKRKRGDHGRADWAWRWSEKLFAFGYENGFIEVRRGGQRSRIYTKTYQKIKITPVGKEYFIIASERTKPLSTLEFTENVYSNDNAKGAFDSLMSKGVFEYTEQIFTTYSPDTVRKVL